MGESALASRHCVVMLGAVRVMFISARARLDGNDASAGETVEAANSNGNISETAFARCCRSQRKIAYFTRAVIRSSTQKSVLLETFANEETSVYSRVEVARQHAVLLFGTSRNRRRCVLLIHYAFVHAPGNKILKVVHPDSCSLRNRSIGTRWRPARQTEAQQYSEATSAFGQPIFSSEDLV
jgi:hypothetical protein